MIELIFNIFLFIICFDIFWFILIPIKKMYILRKKLIKYNSIIICDKFDKKKSYIFLKLYDYILNRFIFDIDSYDDIIKKIKDDNISNIILDTTGGYIVANDILVNFILTSERILNMFVPKKAQSAGTLIALSGYKLYIDKDAYLSPTDPQISLENQDYSIKSIIDLCENKNINYITNKYLLCYYENKKLYNENIILVQKLLKKKFKKNTGNKQKKEFIIGLTSGLQSHHTPLTGIYLNKYLNINLCLPQFICNTYFLFDDIRTN